ncbi:MAG: phosphate acetyltransferase [Trueperaceae bacterium]
MAQALLLTSTGPGTGLTSVAVGLVHALDQRGIRVGFCKPVAQMHRFDTGPERSSHLVSLIADLTPPKPLAANFVADRLAHGRAEELLEDVVARYEEAAKDATIVIVEGLVATPETPYADELNIKIASSLDAKVILVSSAVEKTQAQLAETLELTAREFGDRVLGYILNQVGAPSRESGFARVGEGEDLQVQTAVTHWRKHGQGLSGLALLGVIPWQRELLAPRVRDIQSFIGAKIIHEGDMNRRVMDAALGASALGNASMRMLPGTLYITSGDREDLFMAAAMAELGGQQLAALLLTNNRLPSQWMMDFCKEALSLGLPVLSLPHDSFQSALKVRQLNLELPLEDKDRLQRVVGSVAAHVSLEWVDALRVQGERRLSPAAFRYFLVERAREAKKTIVLPEGEEPRTIKAAAACEERGIAHCILLGKSEKIQLVATQQSVTLPESLTMLDPDTVRQNYIEPMVELRKHKGMIPAAAEEQLQDNVVLGTMMLYLGEVAGLVSGAIHTTANTIRPALQLIKTPPGVKVVSSIFFMCLPEQVLVYGDCAVNPDPNPEELADIAIQSAESAKAFGIEPRVAMLSYSTGESGSGSDVDKVREATRLAQKLRPDLLIDGPLQYDAAAIEDVGKSKAPGSKVAGRATVFVFPDLNTGNTTYKAVQRSADVISVGPMLQGLKKPVNDLSRGALVEDIIYTIALTAIQAKQAESYI